MTLLADVYITFAWALGFTQDFGERWAVFLLWNIQQGFQWWRCVYNKHVGVCLWGRFLLF